MGLYRRTKKASLGNQRAKVDGRQAGLFSILESSPLSSFYKCPCTSDSPRHILIWMLAMQIRWYGATGEEHEPRAALYRNLKHLIEKYGADAVKRSIHAACWRSRHPFSSKFIRVTIEDLGYEPKLRSGGDTQADLFTQLTGTL